jgi:uncharacterized repeat protein (TIGR01451 family)
MEHTMKKFFILLLILGLATPVAAKSVYFAADHHTRAFDAWNMNPDGTIVKQATYTLQYATDPAGVAIHNTRNLLFLTSEFSGGVEIVDPDSLTYYGVSAGVRDLAGIDVDELQDLVYTVQRMTPNLYIYKWDESINELVLQNTVTLPNCIGAMGIALDEFRGILWVADSGNGSIPSGWVRAYNLNVADPSLIVEDTSLSFKPSHLPIDIALDRKKNMLYSVSMYGGAWLPRGSGSYLLSQWDVANMSETTITMAAHGVGVAVDEVTGYVYVTHGAYVGDNVSVWDPSTSPFTNLQTTPPVGNPAGIAIGNPSYNPLSLAKNDEVQGTGIYIGQTFTYKISFSNDNSTAINNVVVLDNLPPELDYVSSTPAGTYDSTLHTVTWVFPTMAAGDTMEIDLVVEVNDQAQTGSTIYNYCTIDCDETPPTTVIGTDPDDPTGEPGNPVIEPPLIEVAVDIKPGSCPNPIEVKKRGVMPVAIAGTFDFDVSQIDPESIKITREDVGVSVPVLRWSFEDAATPYDGDLCGCHALTGDGIMDLSLKFSSAAIVQMLMLDEVLGETIPFTITGNLLEEYGGDTIEGQDCMRVQ